MCSGGTFSDLKISVMDPKRLVSRLAFEQKDTLTILGIFFML
jgi:hypothetical protein